MAVVVVSRGSTPEYATSLVSAEFAEYVLTVLIIQKVVCPPLNDGAGVERTSTSSTWR
jgi:hypothetical protein